MNLKIKNILPFLWLINACSDNAPQPTSASLELKELTKPNQIEAVYTEGLARELVKNEWQKSMINQIRLAHRLALPATLSPLEQKSTPGPLIGLRVDISGDKLGETLPWKLDNCKMNPEQEFKDFDQDSIPDVFKGSVSCDFLGDRAGAIEYSVDNFIKYNFDIKDEDDNDWKSGYTKKIDYAEHLIYHGGAPKPWAAESKAMPPSKRGFDLRHIENIAVKREADQKYLIHSEIQQEAKTFEGERGAFSYSLDIALQAEPTQYVDKTKILGDFTHEALSRKGQIDSLSGSFQFEQGGKFYGFKVSSTSLVFADDPDPSLSTRCLWNVFEAGTITLTDGVGNRLEFKHSVAPGSPKSCETRLMYNDKEIAGPYFY
jgi:hypothetical protein